MNRSTADSPGAVCRIRQTELRGISPRKLLALYEHVKRCCVAEGWERPDGTALTPEAVTLYDLNARASCLQQRPVGTSAGLTRTARRGRERMPRSEVSDGEEITSTNTKFAAKRRETYRWSSRLLALPPAMRRRSPRGWCGACACGGFVELVATPRVAAYLPESDQCGGVS
jgi:hypothetical protein